MISQKTLVIFALVAALGLVAVETVDLLLPTAEAGCERALQKSVAAERAAVRSEGKCVQP